jgi:hypothetical protein
MTGLAALFLPPLESQCLGCHTSDLLDGNLHQPWEVHYRISTKNPRDNPKAQILALFKKLRYHKWHIIWVRKIIIIHSPEVRRFGDDFPYNLPRYNALKL